MRRGTQIIIPEQYNENERKGLCRVCGKPKNEWSGRRRVYCSDACFKKYQECFLTWGGIKSLALKRDENKCRKCGTEHQLEVHHKKPIYKGGPEFDIDNCITLCHTCHVREHNYLRHGTRPLFVLVQSDLILNGTKETKK